MTAWWITDWVFWWRQGRRYRARYENYQGGAPSPFDWKHMTVRERRHMVVYALILFSLFGVVWLMDQLATVIVSLTKHGYLLVVRDTLAGLPS
jgi:hypothetical protein